MELVLNGRKVPSQEEKGRKEGKEKEEVIRIRIWDKY